MENRVLDHEKGEASGVLRTKRTPNRVHPDHLRYFPTHQLSASDIYRDSE